MEKITLEFNSIAELRTKISRLSNDLKAEHLDPFNRAPIEAFPIKYVPMELWLRNSLAAAGINTLGQVCNMTAEEFIDLPGLAEKSLERVNAILNQYGLPSID